MDNAPASSLQMSEQNAFLTTFLTRDSLGHGFDQGTKYGIDGLRCRKNFGNIRIEDHGTAARLQSSRKAIRTRFPVIKAVLGPHLLSGGAWPVIGTGFLHSLHAPVWLHDEH